MLVILFLKLVWVLGAVINITILIKLVLRPSIWSTINTYLGLVLFFNLCFLMSKIFLFTDEYAPSSHQSGLDHNQSCSANVVFNFLHGTPTMLILLAAVFIRFVMIKHAENIRKEKKFCKSHQAHISRIGALVGVLVLMTSLVYIINYMTHDFFPEEFTEVKICKGVERLGREKMSLKHCWLRITALSMLFMFTLSFNIRIMLFRQRHNHSYFSRYRQNIATAYQTLLLIYTKIGFKTMKEVLILCTILGKTHSGQKTHFVLITVWNIVECVLIPGFLLFSTKNHFPEIWSEETLFWFKIKYVKHGLCLTNLREETKKEPRGPYNHNINVFSTPKDMYTRSPEEKYKLSASIEDRPSTMESFEIQANKEVQYNVKKTVDENIKSEIFYIKPYCANNYAIEGEL